MKKAKIMFTAIAVLAVVGGALAFKAQKFSSHIVYTTNAAGQPGINPLPSYTFDQVGNQTTETFATLVQGQPAALTTIYFDGN